MLQNLQINKLQKILDMFTQLSNNNSINISLKFNILLNWIIFEKKMLYKVGNYLIVKKII